MSIYLSYPVIQLLISRWLIVFASVWIAGVKINKNKVVPAPRLVIRPLVAWNSALSLLFSVFAFLSLGMKVFRNILFVVCKKHKGTQTDF